MSNFTKYLSKNWLDDPKSNILSGLVVAFAMIPEAIAFSGIAGKKNDLKEKEIALKWMNESWKKLKIFFPKIHLAQIHNHLNSHEEEVYLSFGERLGELKTLKNICDPESILPPL